MNEERTEPDETPGPATPGVAKVGRKAQTQARILQAAMELFLRRGYSNTSVTRIAARAGVSRAAVFWHFSDKATLFREAGRRFLIPFREELGSNPIDVEPRKRLFELFGLYEAFVASNRSNIEGFLRWVIDSPEEAELLREDLLALHDTYRGEVERALAEILPDREEASALAKGLVSLLDGNLLLRIFGDRTGAESGDGDERLAGLQAITARILKDLGS